MATWLASVLTGLCAGLLSLIASLLAIRAQIANLKEQYPKAIFDERVITYQGAWRITGKLSSRRLRPPSSVSAADIKSAIHELHDWYNAHGFVMSHESRCAYLNLRKLCWDISTEDTADESERQRLYEEIWRRKMDFRHALRVDVLLEPSPRLHGSEDWHFG